MILQVSQETLRSFWGNLLTYHIEFVPLQPTVVFFSSVGLGNEEKRAQDIFS